MIHFHFDLQASLLADIIIRLRCTLMSVCELEILLVLGVLCNAVNHCRFLLVFPLLATLTSTFLRRLGMCSVSFVRSAAA